MKRKQVNPYPLRIDEEVMKELKKVAYEEGRSVNKQIEYIVKKHLDEVKGSQEDSKGWTAIEVGIYMDKIL